MTWWTRWRRWRLERSGVRIGEDSPLAPITEFTDPDTGERWHITKAVDLDAKEES